MPYNMKGRKGEILVQQYLLSMGWQVIDLTNCQDFFSKDIDFQIIKGGEKHYIEVKYDYRIAETNNMFIETRTDLDNDKEGWFNFTQAEFLWYGDQQNDLFYVFLLADLKQYIQEQEELLPQRKAADYDIYQRIRKVSQGYLVNIEDFRKHYPVQIIRL